MGDLKSLAIIHTVNICLFGREFCIIIYASALQNIRIHLSNPRRISEWESEAGSHNKKKAPNEKCTQFSRCPSADARLLIELIEKLKKDHCFKVWKI